MHCADGKWCSISNETIEKYWVEGAKGTEKMWNNTQKQLSSISSDRSISVNRSALIGALNRISVRGFTVAGQSSGDSLSLVGRDLSLRPQASEGILCNGDSLSFRLPIQDILALCRVSLCNDVKISVDGNRVMVLFSGDPKTTLYSAMVEK
jgi:hypothetical protein